MIEMMEPKTTPMERVAAEKAELDEKLQKLSEFLSAKRFAELSVEHQQLLQMQASVMHGYSLVLGRRIEAFHRELVAGGALTGGLRAGETLARPAGCAVCGLGAHGEVMGYVCSHPSCPSRVTCA